MWRNIIEKYICTVYGYIYDLVVGDSDNGVAPGTKFDITAHKKILLDAGHLCQNLYIAAESVECGTCAI